MSTLKDPSKGLLIFAVFQQNLTIAEKVQHIAVQRWGKFSSQTQWFDFHHTDYYKSEMGEHLQKSLWSFLIPISRQDLVAAKLWAIETEQTFSQNGKRTINIDPGLLTLENFILSTGKNFSHRIYLSHGVFADLTLIFQHSQFRDLPWTYPDYKEKIVLDFLTNERLRLKETSTL